MNSPSFDKSKTAVLIVNGEVNPASGIWLELCLQRLAEHTRETGYRAYVWNNAVMDERIPAIVRRHPQARLIQAARGEKLAHCHAVPLQRLYEMARADGVRTITTLDTDAFPIKDGWLSLLIEALTAETVIAGVWRDELKHAVRPYIHASCLCTTVEFIETHKLRLDSVDLDPDKKIDTLSVLTRTAEAGGYRVFKLERSNKNQAHYLMAGIYGDMIYHHGAGSRKTFTFWGEARTEVTCRKNQRLKEILNRLIFEHQAHFIRWLRGEIPFVQDPDPAFLALIGQASRE